MRSRNVISAYVVGLVIVSIFSGMQTMYAEAKDGSFGGGTGTLADPYIIEDVWDLQNMTGDLAAHYALSGDIDASATTGWNAGAGFAPVGRLNLEFTGSLDGRDHTITGLFIKRSTTDNVGLFGYVGASASVKDVGLVQGDVTGRSKVGGLAGTNRGVVDGTYYTGKVTSASYCVGGLVGFNDLGTVDGSHFTGKVVGAGSIVGGLVGENNDGTVNNSYTTGQVAGVRDQIGGLVGFSPGVVANSYSSADVSGTENVGGLVGDNRDTVSDCYSTGNVSGTLYVGGLEGGSFGNVIDSHATGAVAGRKYVGGLVGINLGSISLSYATGDVRGTDDWIAGLVGQSSGVVKYSYSTGNVTGHGGVAGLVGWYNGGTAISSHYDIDTVLINGGHHITYCGLFDAQYQDWDSGGMNLRISDYAATIVPSGGHYEIGTVQGLRDLLGFSDVAGYEYRLATDMDLSTAPGLYIPYLAGDLDGLNHTVSNMDLDLPFANFLGMFGVVASGTVKDLNLLDDRVSGYDFVGGLAGMFYDGATSNLRSIGDVSGRDYVGGLAGYSSGDSVSGLYAMGNVTASNLTGGLVGCHVGNLSDSHAIENVTGAKFVGGLIGYDLGKASDCHSEGVVVGTENVGGLVGYNAGGTVSDCYSTAVVRGTSSVGGLVGLNYGTTSRSYATGSVSGDDTVGGLVGHDYYSGIVVDSYATGDVDGAYNVGGLVGDLYVQGTVDNSYAVGRLTSRVNPGGLVGTGTGRVSNSFWDTETSGASWSAGGTGATTAEMMTRSTFTDAGWDLTHVWFILEDVTYPLLRWQDTQPPVAGAGPDQAVEEGTLVTFDGSGSSDDIGIADMTWTFQDGAPVTLHGVGPQHLFDDPGVFVVTLNVTDAAGAWGTDEMTVTVNDVTAPASDAGPDQVVDEGTLVTFDGSGSSDNAGIANYTWKFTDGAPFALSDVRPSHRFDIPGVFVVTLDVTDAAGNWDRDTMTVTVTDVTSPAADAGPDQTVDEGTLVTFHGSGSSDNVKVVSLTWTFTDGAPITLHGAGPDHRFITPGTFVVELNVTDAAGNWGTDTMTVTVRDVTPPVADAGPDQTVDEGALVTFDGSASTDNVGVVDYTWTIPGAVPVTLRGAHPTYRFTVPGAFVVSLEVADAAGNRDTDAMTVTVKDVTPPVAAAGPDWTVDGGTLVTFDGSGSLDDIGVVNYTWTFRYGTDWVVLHGARPSFKFDAPGVYPVTLNVTDAAGQWSEDSMNVTVNDVTPPLADAGPDRTAPVDGAVSLDGSRSSDNVGIANWSWTLTYDSVGHRLEGESVQFTFGKGGVYEVVLTVADRAGNVDDDRVVITVVDTGKVTGRVSDKDGMAVEGAKVEVTASNGKTYSTTTDANGRFTMVVYNGDLTWRVSKEGYRTVSGSSSVDPMDETDLGLSDYPLVREEKSETSNGLVIIAAVVIVVMVVGIALILLKRKGGGEPKY